ncbi:MAG: hypothetical protein DF168_00579 [Candidatus Moanabacter tarae]|uniref:MFS transporter n=1 Tax=Candidatus Moanibacter tarae TaxID=2200854 RepID=A0A2Z4AP23_9BACT|nr:MAG: hypothetical protein DF168_00579 [Candidatus Moanabacter tarae]|tara:strand:- start:27020 stop:27739 length:720 start_codon:yes stop_codon:yes gene_type:complete
MDPVKNPNSAQIRQENVFLNLVINILLPSLILIKGVKWLSLSPSAALLSAIICPICYGLFDFIIRKRYNLFSIIGFISILITGGIGLLKLDKNWIAIKEAAIPLLIGLAVLVTTKTQKPLVRLFLYNREIIDVVRVDLELDEKGNRTAFEQLMKFCTFLLAGSFFLSASLNYLLAKFLIRSESGTDAFNMELGKMTFWSYPVIFIPSMVVMSLVLWKLLSGIKALTGLNTEEIFRISRD